MSGSTRRIATIKSRAEPLMAAADTLVSHSPAVARDQPCPVTSPGHPASRRAGRTPQKRAERAEQRMVAELLLAARRARTR